MSINRFVQGDTVEFEATVEGIDITGWQIRFELREGTNLLKKSTANSGGADEQIVITDPTNGLFSIYIDAGDTSNFGYNAFMEIELETTDGKIYTPYQEYVEIIREIIKWQTP